MGQYALFRHGLGVVPSRVRQFVVPDQLLNASLAAGVIDEIEQGALWARLGARQGQITHTCGLYAGWRRNPRMGPPWCGLDRLCRTRICRFVRSYGVGATQTDVD